MFEERMVLPDGCRMEFRVFDDMTFHVSCLKGKRQLVEYKSRAKGCVRVLHGRASAYEFKSVEKLRYDFERDAEDAQRQG